MICTCIHDRTYAEILEILSRDDVEMAEIRLDSCKLTDEEIEDLFSNSETPLVATCRDADGAERLLTLAIESGARFADLEIDAPAPLSRSIRNCCKRCGTELIRSFHDFSQTPSDELLQRILARCFRYGADIAKVVTMCNCSDDADRIESLYSCILEDIDSLQGRLIAFGMGEFGRPTRVECLRRGAPFTYSALSIEDSVAPGQMDNAAMRRMVYSGFGFFKGDSFRVPASKSFAQRAIIAAALSDGSSRLTGYTPCGDSEAALRVAEALGATVRREATTLEITGCAPAPGSVEPAALNVGESGLLARLMIPLLSVLGKGMVGISGEGTLPLRPLVDAGPIMASFGVLLSNISKSRRGELYVPLSIKGHLIPGVAEVSGAGGSQLISGLLMALPLCSRSSRLHVSDPKSIPYMYMTLDVLRHFGIQVSSEMEGDARMLEAEDWSCCTGIDFSVKGNQRYRPADFAIEGDWSTAANLLVAGAVFGGVEVEGLDIKSLQADLAIVDILVEAGAVVSQTEDGTVCVRRAPLEGFSTDLSNAPDLFPIVAVLAAFCAGQSRISGLCRLVGKESDRSSGILEALSLLGVEACASGDELLVEGESLASRILNARLLHGGPYSSHHDHRMALALKVAGLGSSTPIVLDDEECICKSVDTAFREALPFLRGK